MPTRVRCSRNQCLAGLFSTIGCLDHMYVRELLRQPSAFLPIVMSLAALALVLGVVATVGVVREPDEGTAAHVWQLLMASQIPIVGYFALRWLPRAPRQGLAVLALQSGAALAALAPVWLLQL